MLLVAKNCHFPYEITSKGLQLITLPETNSSPLKIGRAPKGNDRIPTLHFQVLYSLLVSGSFWSGFFRGPGLSDCPAAKKSPRFPIVHSEGSLEKSIEAVKSLDVRECKASVPRLDLGFLGIGALGNLRDPWGVLSLDFF